MKSFLRNCYVQARSGADMLFSVEQVGFYETQTAVLVALDGYAILPMEDFEHLKVLAEKGAAVLASDLLRQAAQEGKP